MGGEGRLTEANEAGADELVLPTGMRHAQQHPFARSYYWTNVHTRS